MNASIAIAPLSAFRATLRPPGSKSLTNRALLLAALGDGESRLTGVLFSDDTRVMLDALGRLGFELEIDEAKRTVTVRGCGGRLPAEGAELMLGNAGTAMRFLTAACCLGKGSYTLDGIARMRERPIAELVNPLRQLGAEIEYLEKEGYPPLRIRGTGVLGGGRIVMPPTMSSQYISALLQVGAYCERGLTLEFEGAVTSQPYVAMTLGLMARFGVEAEVDASFTRIGVERGCYRALDEAIEPDASNASYFLAAAAIVPGATCTIEGLGKGSLQGDVGFADVLCAMGADMLYGRDFITIKSPPVGRGFLRGIDVDLNHMPDMAQTLAAVAMFARGSTTIRNIGNLRVKETDRLAALQKELTKLGAVVEIEGDDLFIDPPAQEAGGRPRLTAAAIDTYDDHRMAMSFAVIGLGAAGDRPVVTINDPQCVNKTFPDFFEYLDGLREKTCPPDLLPEA